MQLDWRRVIVTLLWAGAIIAAGPAIGYAEVASEHTAQADTRFESPSSADDAGLWFATPPEPAFDRQGDAE